MRKHLFSLRIEGLRFQIYINVCIHGVVYFTDCWIKDYYIKGKGEILGVKRCLKLN